MLNQLHENKYFVVTKECSYIKITPKNMPRRCVYVTPQKWESEYRKTEAHSGHARIDVAISSMWFSN